MTDEQRKILVQFHRTMFSGPGFAKIFAHQQASAAALTERDTLLEALKGVLRVADRKTDEFDAARAAIARAEGREP